MLACQNKTTIKKGAFTAPFPSHSFGKLVLRGLLVLTRGRIAEQQISFILLDKLLANALHLRQLLARLKRAVLSTVINNRLGLFGSNAINVLRQRFGIRGINIHGCGIHKAGADQ